MAALVFVWCVMLWFVSTGVNGDTIVNTTLGQLLGTKQKLDGADYYIFKGVPYAEPPVGPLRFRAPLPKVRMTRVFNATRFGPSCPQDVSGVAQFYPAYMVQIPEGANETSEEDCLTLNIYTPVDLANMTWKSDAGLAVVLYIHGGSYLTGQGSGYDASALAVRGGVVVVTINYRLNVFGFFSTNDENAPGNFGMLDQQLALQWVHENIAGFGGDPSRVTLFGQSAGADAVSLHAFANKSRPFFKRVASHSGPSTLAFVPSRSYVASNSLKVAQALDCSSSATEEILDCLRNRTTEDILSTALSFLSPLSQFFLPVIDDVFLSSSVGYADLAHDYLILHTSGDGSVILEVAKDVFSPAKFNVTKGITKDQFKDVLGLFIPNSLSVTAVTREYASEKDTNYMEALVDFMLDWNYINLVGPVVENQPKLSSLRWAIFDYHSQVDSSRYPGLTRAPHGEELPYVFGLPFTMTSSFTDEERKLSDRVMRYWTNFFKTGDPNVNPDVNTTSNLTYWPEYGDSETYLLIQLNDSSVGQGYRKDKVMFWSDYLPKLTTAADEYCSNQRESMEPPTSDKPGCKIFIGEGLGLKLTQQQAETLIEVFMFVIIALLVILIIVFGALMGYKFKYKDRQAAIKKNGVQTNGDLKKNAAFEVNEGFTPEFEDTKM
ncbi:liver carboxylesterase 1-like isoform X3 [Patiria miniata]|uniref:Carboxylic ester hydrolase n=1 Tax=Patiria miniata TaxID=46514 RepID=A0A913ZYY1_PATMI|nr:liver carboxylesterase 1-like isoform X3 [Patiria miniata]